MYKVYDVQNKTSIHIPQHSPASRRSLCHQGNCHGIQWRTSLAMGPGWEHSPQPGKVTFQCLLSLGIVRFPNSRIVEVGEPDYVLHDCSKSWRTCPTSISAVNFLAVAPLVVKIAVPFPVVILFSWECTKNALLFNFWNHRGCCWWAQWLPRGYQHSKHKALVQKSPLCRPGNIGLEWVTAHKVCHKEKNSKPSCQVSFSWWLTAHRSFHQGSLPPKSGKNEELWNLLLTVVPLPSKRSSAPSSTAD